MPITMPRFQDLFDAEEGANISSILNDLPAFAQEAADNGASANASNLLTILELQRDWILNRSSALSENFASSYYDANSTSIGTLSIDSWSVCSQFVSFS